MSYQVTPDFLISDLVKSWVRAHHYFCFLFIRVVYPLAEHSFVRPAKKLSANQIKKNEELLGKPSKFYYLVHIPAVFPTFQSIPPPLDNLPPGLVLCIFRPPKATCRLLGFHPAPIPLGSPGVLSLFIPISGKTGGSRLITTTPSTGVSVRIRTGL